MQANNTDVVDFFYLKNNREIFFGFCTYSFYFINACGHLRRVWIFLNIQPYLHADTHEFLAPHKNSTKTHPYLSKKSDPIYLPTLLLRLGLMYSSNFSFLLLWLAGMQQKIHERISYIADKENIEWIFLLAKLLSGRYRGNLTFRVSVKIRWSMKSYHWC